MALMRLAPLADKLFGTILEAFKLALAVGQQLQEGVEQKPFEYKPENQERDNESAQRPRVWWNAKHLRASPCSGRILKILRAAGIGARDDQPSLVPPAATCATTRSSLATIGVTLRSSLTSGFMAQCPSNRAPSCTTRTGVVRLPKTLAVGRISTRLLAVMSPLILPAITTEAALTCAVTTALSHTTSASLEMISPST